MKTKVKEISYEEFLKIKPYKRFKPHNPSIILNKLIRFLAKGELKKVGFTYITNRLEEVKDDEPCLILMNHSCFLDLKIAFTLLKNRKFNIVMTDDGFVGKAWLMKHIGCIPTMKFITDIALVKDMLYVINEKKHSILLYPEASYSFDGTATPLPSHFGKLVKKLNVPVIMIKTKGAFLHDPLYNNLQLRDVLVSAHMEVIFNHEEVNTYSVEKINDIVNQYFTFNAFEEQIKENIKVTEPFRADHLNRLLYKCPACQAEHMMEGVGITLKCHHCQAEYTLEENGTITSKNTKVIYDNPSKWYQYERSVVKEEILNKTYQMSFACDIYAMKDLKAIYKIGEGTLVHNLNGYTLDGCNGKLHYEHKVVESYSVYSDFYWYEIGDIICIGNHEARYYCIPKNVKDVVCKLRIASEELYKNRLC